MRVRACASRLLAFAVTVLGAVALAAGEGEGDEGKQLIMLEVERLEYPEDKVVKRQAQVQYGAAPGQFVVRASDPGNQQQVPPEYLTLLHQLSPRQTQPHEIQQILITRNPQESYAEYSSQPEPAPLPPRPPLTAEQEQMRRLQEEQANKHIREQQERALQRALQTGQFQPGFQPQPYQLIQSQQPQQVYQPQQLRQPSPEAQQYEPQGQSLSQYVPSSSFSLEPQYSQPPSAPQFYQQTRSIRPSQSPKYSYSETQYGSLSDEAREDLESRLASVQQKLQSQLKAKPEYYTSIPQPQPQQQPQVDYSAANVEPQQQTPTQPQHPQQYLIETTHLRNQPAEDPVVSIPRPRRPPPAPQSLYYRPQPAPAPAQYKPPEPYTTIPNNYISPQYPTAHRYVSEAPSRSAIYVQHGGVRKTTQQPSPYNSYPGYTPPPRIPRIPTPGGQRPLTSSEIEALSKAGFNISPLALNSVQEPSEISPSYSEDTDDYRSPNNKRQSHYIDERKPPGKYPKRIPKPVPLTETERKLLADQGIRNLYRVESSESKDAPVTYVLAIDSTIRKRESDTTTDENDSS